MNVSFCSACLICASQKAVDKSGWLCLGWSDEIHAELFGEPNYWWKRTRGDGDSLSISHWATSLGHALCGCSMRVEVSCTYKLASYIQSPLTTVTGGSTRYLTESQMLESSTRAQRKRLLYLSAWKAKPRQNWAFQEIRTLLSFFLFFFLFYFFKGPSGKVL